MHDFSYTAAEAGPQIYIIKDCEKMNQSAANSLLKFLEEPAPDHYAILTTTNKARLLPTIISRLQHIHFKPIGTTYIMNELIKEDVDNDLAYITSHITNDIVEARKYATEGKLAKIINLALRIATARFRRKDPYVEYYLNKNILFDENIKTWHFIFLDTLILINKELLLKASIDSANHFKNNLDNIRSDQIDKKTILNKLDIINEYEERLNFNVNIDLLYASLFTQI